MLYLQPNPAARQVPLLDMRVYSTLLAGASWMAEYGDPDTADWGFMRAFSAYHVLRHDCLGLPEPPEETPPEAAKGESKPGTWRCPHVLFTTSTRDDRVRCTPPDTPPLGTPHGATPLRF